MNVKNILLIRTTDNPWRIPPLGVLYIASIIRNKHQEYNIKIIDYMHEVSDFRGFIKSVSDFSPDVIGFSSLTCEFKLFKELTSLARKAAPKSTLIAGGPLASSYCNMAVKDRLVDFAVIGEGELTISELLDTIQNCGDPSGVKGIAYLKDGEIVITPPREYIQNLDEIPFPSWDLINLKSYSKVPNWNGVLSGEYYAPLMTSRGCIYHCIYCHDFFGKTFRPRSAENVLSEMEFLYKNHDIREFHIIDDIFNFDLERVRLICNNIIQRKLKIRLSFPNGIRADRMDNETLALLRKAGTYKITYAVESASPRLQKFIKKNLDLKKAKDIIELTSKMNIVTAGFFMLGFPTETAEEMKETVSFAINSRLDTAKFFKVIPFCNTELAGISPNFKYGSDLKYSKETSYYDEELNFSSIPLDILNNILLECHWKFYTKFSRIFRILAKYRSLAALKGLLTVYTYVLMRRSAEKGKRHSESNNGC
ncbi:MAG: B12-binding domain-containing radical SAM protein [Deltaproteobacteria bacterium]